MKPWALAMMKSLRDWGEGGKISTPHHYRMGSGRFFENVDGRVIIPHRKTRHTKRTYEFGRYRTSMWIRMDG